jgi:thioesterase domain-containing protein
VIDFSNYPADFKRYAEIHWNALSNYHPKHFGGRILLFRTQRPRLLEFNPEDLWSGLTRAGVDVKIVPGTHEKILDEPYVQVLAQELSKCLAPRGKLQVLQVKAA